jgi:DNA-binding PadR family transcriptional regulator
VTFSDIRTSLPLGASTFYILLALAGGDRHGYGVIKEVQTQTAGAVKLGPGTLYRLIKQLLADGWIAAITASPSAAAPSPAPKRNGSTPW